MLQLSDTQSTFWPSAPATEVFRGPAGEFVELTEPHTEADPMALLAQFLIAFGVAAGRNCFYGVEATRHFPNEFCVLVGSSGKGRKGSSWEHVEQLMATCDPEFVDECLAMGLSSGEGLIAEVRDGKEVEEANKRVLVLEQEFAQVMKVLAREGNTLSPVVRQAWDGKTLQTMAKNSPMRATNAHIALVGHITKDELLRYLGATELANGFFNRFLVIAVQRSKELPFGGQLKGEDLRRIREELKSSLDFSSRPRQIGFDREASELWVSVYGDLSQGRAGLLGAATARAEAHCVRLALIYALLDRSEKIGKGHLEAALAFWSYAAESARWIFGESLGDPTADDIWALARERSGGVSRTEVRDLFSRNKKSREIDRALTVLVESGRLERREQSDGKGRPAEIWVPSNGA